MCENCPNLILSYIWIVTYVEELLKLFDTAAVSFPGLGREGVRAELRRTIEDKKYDLQDEALIEGILKVDSRELVESFTSAFGSVLHGLDNDTVRAEFLDGDGAVKEAIRVYIASLEHLIDYYHTSLIGKHFTST